MNLFESGLRLFIAQVSEKGDPDGSPVAVMARDLDDALETIRLDPKAVVLMITSEHRLSLMGAPAEQVRLRVSERARARFVGKIEVPQGAPTPKVVREGMVVVGRFPMASGKTRVNLLDMSQVPGNYSIDAGLDVDGVDLHILSSNSRYRITIEPMEEPRRGGFAYVEPEGPSGNEGPR